MKVICTGGRDFTNRSRIYEDLNEVSPDFVVVGDARGADMLVREWCREHGVYYEEYEAHWRLYGRYAGNLRNETMVNDHKDADYVLAWPDPASRGTYDCLRRCFIAGIKKYKQKGG